MHVLMVALALSLAAQAPAGSREAPAENTSGWQRLFDGKTLGSWTPTKFHGEGAVTVQDERIVLEAGRDLTGITYTGGDLPNTNYELALDAMRVEGSDFFAGITFPVADSFCTLILGGWGGTVVGLSSIGGSDASENDTSQSIEFERGRWYRVRIQVTPQKIQAWLDDRQIIDQDLKGRAIDIRIEMLASKPLGIASWKTKSALRDIRLRRL